jgi:hypothetical protein
MRAGQSFDQRVALGIVHVVNRELGDSAIEQLQPDRAARPTCPHEQRPFSLRLAARMRHRAHEAQAIGHIAVPGPIGIAAYDISRVEQPGPRRNLATVTPRGEFMGNGRNDAVDVLDRTYRVDEGVDMVGKDVDGDDHRVAPALEKSPCQTCGRLHLSDGVADDHENSRLATQHFQHRFLRCARSAIND